MRYTNGVATTNARNRRVNFSYFFVVRQKLKYVTILLYYAHYTISEAHLNSK